MIKLHNKHTLPNSSNYFDILYTYLSIKDVLEGILCTLFWQIHFDIPKIIFRSNWQISITTIFILYQIISLSEINQKATKWTDRSYQSGSCYSVCIFLGPHWWGLLTFSLEVEANQLVVIQVGHTLFFHFS